MSAQRKMDMRNFFNTVKRKGEHIANMAVQQYRDEAKEELDVAMREELPKIFNEVILPKNRLFLNRQWLSGTAHRKMSIMSQTGYEIPGLYVMTTSRCNWSR